MNAREPQNISSKHEETPPLRKTPLHALHRELGAKFCAFAGYDMPLHFGPGIVKEHCHVRAAAGLFDVSHMGQATLAGSSFETAASAFEALVPADIVGLKPGRVRYTQLLNEDGGIIDDLIAGRSADGRSVMLVVNASRKESDFKHIAAAVPPGVKLLPENEAALLALQGPKSAEVLSRLVPAVDKLAFMTSGEFQVFSVPLKVSRSGYTGEDGFEISISAGAAERFARRLLAEPEVLPAGLGARDTLRLEAGLCLYGQDMDETTSPVEAALTFSIDRKRLAKGGFPGAKRLARELAEGPVRIRAGLKLDGRAAARPGMTVALLTGEPVGTVTSGTFTPTANAAIAMAYLRLDLATPGTRLAVEIRGSPALGTTVAFPFVAHRYARQNQAKAHSQ
jgi:aminomethyltransferase